MGKTNKAQRTKGNTKPSSSGHSAQLLGKPLTGFIGFDVLEKDAAQFIPVTGQQELGDSSVDSDFRMVMRKMLKRDAITRLKAMQEFGDLCLEKDKDAVKNVLLFWPRLFNKLAMDYDRRVRESTHISHGKLLSVVKREIAPHLKSIMGTWLMGQCDSHPPSSTAARTSFHLTFPPNKRAEAVIFCKSEIFANFKDNLFEVTAKSICEPNSASPEEMENKYILVVSATLQALKLVVDMGAVPEELHQSFQDILSNAKFWKVAKSKEPQIRASWFVLVSGLCAFDPSLLVELEKKLATTVFSCLSESDPLVAPAVWEAALNVTLHLQGCWSGVDVGKVVLPQLWTVLRSGANAHSLYPCLLPFLSKMPQNIVHSQDFLQRFFTCIIESLSMPNIRQSSLECDAVVTAFVECLQFVTCCYLVDKDHGPQILDSVLQKDVLPLVEKSLFDCGHVAASKFYPLLGSLLRKMEKLAQDKSTYSSVLDAFWQKLLVISCQALDLELDLTCLSFLYHSLLQATPLQEVPDDEIQGSLLTCVQGNARSLGPVIQFSKALCNKLHENCQPAYIRLLEEVLSSASSYQLVSELVHGSPVHFVQEIVLKWADQLSDDPSPLLNLVLVLCTVLPDEEARTILDCCSQSSLVFLECLLNERTLHPFLESWLLTSSCFTRVLEQLHQQVASKHFYNTPMSTEIAALHRILRTAISSKMLDESKLEEVVSALHDVLEQLPSVEMSHDCSIALQFFQDLAVLVIPEVSWELKAAHKLVTLIFKIYLKEALNFKNSESICGMFITVICKFVSSYLSAKKSEAMSDNSLLHKMVHQVSDAILFISRPKEASHLLNLCHDWVPSLCKTHSVLPFLLPSPENWNTMSEHIVINTLPLLLTNKYFNLPLTCDTFNQSEDSILQFQLVCGFVASILQDVFPQVTSQEMLECHLPHLALCLTFCIRNESKLELKGKPLADLLKKLLLSLARSEVDLLFNILLSLSQENNNWALTFQYFTELFPHIKIEHYDFNEDIAVPQRIVNQVAIAYLTELKNQQRNQTLLQQALEMENVDSSDFWAKMGEIRCCFEARPSDLESEISEEVELLVSQVIIKVIASTKDGCMELQADTLYCFDTISSVLLPSPRFSENHCLPDGMNSSIKIFFSLLQKFKERMCLDTPADVLMLHQVVNLFSHLPFYIETFRNSPRHSDDQQLPLPRDIQEEFIYIAIQVASGCREPQLLVLKELRKVLKEVEGEAVVTLLSHHEELFSVLVQRLTSTVRPLQFVANDLLSKIMPLLPPLITETQTDEESEEEYQRIPSKLEPLLSLLSFLDDIMETMLCDVGMGDLCVVVPNTDSHTVALAYLFAWRHMIDFIAAAPPQMRVGYAADLEERNLLSGLFSHLFCLMPPKPIACLKMQLPTKDDLKKLFSQPLCTDDPSSEEVQQMACFVYACTLRRVPASVRTWWNNLDRRSAEIVNSFTSNYISSLLCFEEVQAVHDNEKQFEKMVVVARPGSREVVATYTIDDCSLELAIQLPPNHPLGPVTAERRGKVVLGQQEWRHWIMQLTTLLTHQNGSILDGLSAWHRNLAKKFEGAEECMICYYVLHSSTLRMPRLSCRICRKRFHHTCLYKWFKTSNNSTCPLCRNEFTVG